jgi:hypothetical protein
VHQHRETLPPVRLKKLSQHLPRLIRGRFTEFNVKSQNGGGIIRAINV